LCVLTITFILH